MKFINDIQHSTLKDTVVVLGNFDGLHKGHLTLLSKAKDIAKEQQLKTAFFTFYPHPTHVLSKHEVALINTDMEKQHVAENEGMDYYIQFPFTKETASMEPEDFIQTILHEHLGAKAVVVGEDYAFGKMRKGNIETLEHYSHHYGYSLHAMKKISYNNRIISSTWIREAIQEADMDLAETLMGRPYFVTGIVIEGAKLGRTIGYPTANVKPDGHKQLPRNGIYATEVDVLGQTYYGLTYVGTKPTIDENIYEILVETYIIDFDQEIYGERILVKFHKFLRTEEKYDSLEELVTQMKEDEKDLRAYYNL